ncbi:GntR family transcriptional regulator [Deinococcus sp. UYEF24]
MVITKLPLIREQVYLHLLNCIISGQYRPGEVLQEAQIAKSLEVSRTPVGNALVMLRERGLLSGDDHKPRVPVLTLKDVTDLYWTRLGLDGVAARLAAQQARPDHLNDMEVALAALERQMGLARDYVVWVEEFDFHQAIYRATENAHLIRMVKVTGELALVYQHSVTSKAEVTGADSARPGRSTETIYSEHRAIYEAIRDRAPEQAEQAAREHILNVIAHIQQAGVIQAASVL